jgi:hypothetical protein
VVAAAQETTLTKATCQFVGNSTIEPIGDRDGHGVLNHEYSCAIAGGLADGAIMTGMVIAETEKGGNVLITGNGMLRKPGGLAVYESKEQQTSLTLNNGKISGFTGTTSGAYKLAGGSLSALSGKT